MPQNLHNFSESPVTLRFHDGTLVIDGLDAGREPPCGVWDRRTQQWRAKALDYVELRRWLDRQLIPLEDQAPRFECVPIELRHELLLRPYQSEAIEKWKSNRCRGVVVLPTGSGKTRVALQAMAEVAQSTMIILPTLHLMNQWYEVVSNAFGLEIGILGGGFHEIRPVTVTTYDSAFRYMDLYGNRFALLIFDEVHHLPSPSYTQIAEMSLAPYRLGLTATYERPDGLHGKLERLVGPLLYDKSIRDLEGEFLAPYETIRLIVDLTPDEATRYQKSQQIFSDYLKKKGIKFFGKQLETLLLESAYEPDARAALMAHYDTRRIILHAEKKFELLDSLLKRHHGDRILVFTASTQLVYRISETFLIPALTHHTKAPERKRILDKFRSGRYSVLVTSRVLNEGVDVPEANVAIVLSGTGSPVEHLQRLGRILRKMEDKEAVLYEIVTRGTKESQISYRRRRSDAYH